eukprot:gnl/MRDRNA2_/MRDRNA2_59448_c0_seq2.p1 gnl/MRDRNA2_/MRDRNA2_59448_c0~~gnl/MRDRNA2_/MRDRNA2_59448_c0_seq2.p1  ORF type:complete len:231 (-),score=24.57 gnl/MRDRNA2_/MRDRNA2_59448_c0_seq2:338-1030(-)
MFLAGAAAAGQHLAGAGKVRVTRPDGDRENQRRENVYHRELRCARLRCSVFDTYAITSALFSGFGCHQALAFTLFEAREAEVKGDLVITVALHLERFAFSLCTCLSVYSTIVFSFSALYSKTALCNEDLNGLVILENFLKSTQALRQYAFRTLRFAMVGFSATLPVGFFARLEWQAACLASIPIVIYTIITSCHSNMVMRCATPIFSTPARKLSAVSSQVAMSQEGLKRS